MTRLAITVREREATTTEPGLGSLRARLAGAGAAAREQVMVDFLEDDLRSAEDALEQLRAYVTEVGATLRGGGARRADLLRLARGDRPVESLDELQATVAGLRRRLAVVALRLPT